MYLAWFGLIVEIFFFSIISPLITNTELTAIFFIGINIFLVLITISKYPAFFRNMFYFAFFFRLIAMFWDVYATNIFRLPNSGGDSEGFFSSAVIIASNLQYISDNIYGGLYAKVLGIIFAFTVPERLVGQYINVLLGLTTVVLLYKTLKLLQIDPKIIKRSIAIIAFFPNAIIFSGFFLREYMVTMFAMCSIYYFVTWYIGKNVKSILFSILFLLIASTFHSGVIGIIMGYAFFYMFYNHQLRKFSFGYKTVGIFVFFLGMGIVVVSEFSNVFLAKFAALDEIEDIYATGSKSRGSSAYLSGLEIKSLTDLVLFGPIKMFYFLTSPLPTDWRGLGDMVAFCIDGLLYFWIIWYSIINIKTIKKNYLAIGLVIMLLSTSFIFGIGTSNAGTAMRHRHKILPEIILLYAVVSSAKLGNIHNKFKY